MSLLQDTKKEDYSIIDKGKITDTMRSIVYSGPIDFFELADEKIYDEIDHEDCEGIFIEMDNRVCLCAEESQLYKLDNIERKLAHDYDDDQERLALSEDIIELCSDAMLVTADKRLLRNVISNINEHILPSLERYGIDIKDEKWLKDYLDICNDFQSPIDLHKKIEQGNPLDMLSIIETFSEKLYKLHEDVMIDYTDEEYENIRHKKVNSKMISYVRSSYECLYGLKSVIKNIDDKKESLNDLLSLKEEYDKIHKKKKGFNQISSKCCDKAIFHLERRYQVYNKRLYGEMEAYLSSFENIGKEHIDSITEIISSLDTDITSIDDLIGIREGSTKDFRESYQNNKNAWKRIDALFDSPEKDKDDVFMELDRAINKSGTYKNILSDISALEDCKKDDIKDLRENYGLLMGVSSLESEMSDEIRADEKRVSEIRGDIRNIILRDIKVNDNLRELEKQLQFLDCSELEYVIIPDSGRFMALTVDEIRNKKETLGLLKNEFLSL